jgi:hypothetical protein
VLQRSQCFAMRLVIRCGVQEKLKILDGCPVLAKCDEEKSQDDLGTRRVFRKDKIRRIKNQIELKQCRMKLSDVVKKLLEQL